MGFALASITKALIMKKAKTLTIPCSACGSVAMLRVYKHGIEIKRCPCV